MNRLLIYIGEVLLDLYDKSILAITYQIVDIRNLTVRNISYSSSLDLPLTENNITQLGNINNIKSNSSIPYSKQTVRCVSNGIEYFTGLMEVSKVNKSIKVAIYNNVIDIFDSIRGKKLHQLNFLTDTAWTSTAIDAVRNSTSGVTAPVINWGDFDTATPSINATLYLPSYFYMEVIMAILESTGYDFEGDVLTDPNFTDLIIPFGAESFEYVGAFQDERTFSATNSTPQTEISPAGAPGPAIKVNVIDTIISEGINAWYEPLNSRWQIPDFGSSGNLGNLIFEVTYDITVNIGTSAPDMFVGVTVYKNGITGVMSTGPLDVGGGDPVYNLVGTFNNNFTGASPITYQDLDYFEIFLDYSDTGSGTFSSIVVNSIYFSGYVKTTINRNFLFHNYLLPDIEQIEILKDFFVRAGAFLNLEKDNKTVTVRTLKEVIKDKASAKDWTLKRVLKQEEINFNYKDYAQENLFKYKEVDGVPDVLGMGILPVNNENLEPDSDYFESIFENCLTQSPDDTLLINMAYIPVYDGTSVTIEDFVNEPGLKLLTLRDKLTDEPEITFSATPRNDYKVAYFVDTAQSKDTGFEYFLSQYYAELELAFDKTKFIERDYILNESDVLDNPFLIFDAGNYFLVNKIPKFIPNKITQGVELLRVF